MKYSSLGGHPPLKKVRCDSCRTEGFHAEELRDQFRNCELPHDPSFFCPPMFLYQNVARTELGMAVILVFTIC
jgi:hypothetical protein